MAWRKITEADVTSSLNDAENSGYRHLPHGTNTPDPLPDLISQVTMQMREAIRTCGRNRLAEDPEALPEAAIGHAVALIRHRLLGRFDAPMSEGRLLEYREAQNYIRAIAACERAVELPDGSEADRPKMAPPAINQSPRRDGWRNQDGI